MDSVKNRVITLIVYSIVIIIASIIIPILLGNLRPLFFNWTLDFLLIFLAFPFGSTILSLLISPYLLKILKWVNIRFNSQYKFGYLDINEEKDASVRIKRSVVPFFLAFSLSFYLMPMLENTIWYLFTGQTLSEMSVNTLPGTRIFILSMLLFILSSVAAFIITISWASEDSNIVQFASFDNKETPNLVGMGRWIRSGLKGFASITFILSYYQLIAQYILYLPQLTTTTPILLVFYLLVPFDFFFIFIPIHIFYYLLFEKMNMKERIIKTLDVKAIEYNIEFKENPKKKSII